jgi:hypothetical protein
MSTVSKINVARVAVGGLAAGAVLFVVTGVVNGAILKDDLESWSQSMAGMIHPPAPSVAMSLWALMCLISGAVGVWIYACMRARYGAGPKTALLAGLAVWLVSKLCVALDFMALGLLPGPIVAGQMIGGLVSIMLATLAGAALYRD